MVRRLLFVPALIILLSSKLPAQDISSGLSMARLKDAETFAINAENPTGAKGAGGSVASHLGAGRKGRPALGFPAGKTIVLADIAGTGVINHIWITVSPPAREYKAGPNPWRDIVIRMYWDGAKTPCVEAPLGDFFGLGLGVSSSLISQMVTVSEGRGLNCYWPMPFRKSARIEVENQGKTDVSSLFFQIDGERVKKFGKSVAYFHAQWRRENPTIIKQDYTILEASGNGKYVGTMLSLVPLSGNWWGEGEVKLFIDGDKDLPTIAGTGTEDYFGSAWGIGEFNTPYHGAPTERKGLVSMYRWHVQDPIYFKKDIRVTIQNIGYGPNGLYERSDDMCSTAYWYQTEPHKDFPTLPDVEHRLPRPPVMK